MQFLGFPDKTVFWVIRRIPLLDYLETVVRRYVIQWHTAHMIILQLSVSLSHISKHLARSVGLKF